MLGAPPRRGARGDGDQRIAAANGHIDEFCISHVQRSDGWIVTTYNNMSALGAFAGAGAEEQESGDGETPPLADAGVVVCLMG